MRGLKLLLIMKWKVEELTFYMQMLQCNPTTVKHLMIISRRYVNGIKEEEEEFREGIDLHLTKVHNIFDGRSRC